MVWASSEGIPLHAVECITPFYTWTDTLVVWVFFDTKKEAKAHKKCGSHPQMEKKFTELLIEHHYPFDTYPNINFNHDSHENVLINFGGNYFNRLR